MAFVQGLEAFALDCGEVYEYIVAAFNFDKTKAFFSVEPFNCTSLHVWYLLEIKFNMFFLLLKQIKIHIL
ncbi:hypothetical protein HMPREF9413_5181 [Paenibacillus sp. HGF7]|nr:hypothetical protein HMPREF9413_5181 [Paenibacillus sp. HGF7]